MDEILEGIDLANREINGKKISEDDFPKLMTREEIIKIQQAAVKALLLL